MSKIIPIRFDKGVMPPAKIGTLQTKPTADGFLAYAQNIDTSNDEYGIGLVTPGPALTTITGNSNLTGVPFAKAVCVSDAGSFDFLMLAEGLLGATNIIRIITDVEPGGSPAISNSKTVTHNDAAGDDTGHTSIVIHDIMEFQDSGGNFRIIVVGKDATDNFVMKATISSGGTPIGGLFQITTFTARTGGRHKLFNGEDGKVYVTRAGWPASLLSIDGDLTAVTSVTASKFTMPQGKAITAMGRFNGVMAIAYSTATDGPFSSRKSSATSGVILWDYITAQTFIKDIFVPTNHISAVVNDPSGDTLLFGGLDQGKTTIFQLSGYGVIPLVSYIGDMPYSNHSVTFDALGRIMWQTVNGQLMRFDKRTGKLEHLGTISVTAGYGGMLCKLLGDTGNDFLMAGGTDASPDTFLAKKVIFGSYLGDGNGDDGITTPLAVSGTEFLPDDSSVSAITLYLSRALQTGEKVVLRIYENGSLTGSDYLTMEYAVDGAISAKREVFSKTDLNNFALGVVYKQADGSTTAPPVATANVEIN